MLTPGTDSSTGLAPTRPCPWAITVHVDAAAYAALLAVDQGKPGIYNVADLNTYATTAKASTELGWNADFRQ
jgi:hypothetical protein